jgi:hypothetical protein
VLEFETFLALVFDPDEVAALSHYIQYLNTQDAFLKAEVAIGYV